MTDRSGYLVERVLDVGRDREDIAHIGDSDRLAQIHAQLEAVRSVQRRDSADALRPEPGAGTVGSSSVERRAEHDHVIVAAGAHVLHIRCLEKRVDAGEVWQLAAGESWYPSVYYGVRGGQSELKAARNLMFPCRGWQLSLAPDRIPGLWSVVVMSLGVSGLCHSYTSTCRSPGEVSRAT